MIKSVITTWTGYDEFSEMLIPKVVGETSKGFLNRSRINRLLPLGHRYHGYEV